MLFLSSLLFFTLISFSISLSTNEATVGDGQTSALTPEVSYRQEPPNERNTQRKREKTKSIEQEDDYIKKTKNQWRRLLIKRELFLCTKKTGMKRRKRYLN